MRRREPQNDEKCVGNGNGNYISQNKLSKASRAAFLTASSGSLSAFRRDSAARRGNVTDFVIIAGEGIDERANNLLATNDGKRPYNKPIIEWVIQNGKQRLDCAGVP